MIGDLMSAASAQSKELNKRLKDEELSADSGGGAVNIVADGTGHVKDLAISDEVDLSDKEMLQDLIIEAFNRLHTKVEENKAVKSSEMIKGLIPPGMEGMFKM